MKKSSLNVEPAGKETLTPIPSPADAGEGGEPLRAARALLWIEIGRLADIPRQGARVVRRADGDIAVFRTIDDEIFALRDRCPHKGGPLSQGIVHGRRVACPLHDWKVHLDSGQAVAPDEGCTPSYPVRIENDIVWLNLMPNANPPCLEK